MGMRLWTDQTFLGGILDFETEEREVAVQNRVELR